MKLLGSQRKCHDRGRLNLDSVMYLLHDLNSGLEPQPVDAMYLRSHKLSLSSGLPHAPAPRTVDGRCQSCFCKGTVSHMPPELIRMENKRPWESGWGRVDRTGPDSPSIASLYAEASKALRLFLRAYSLKTVVQDSGSELATLI